MPTVGVAAQEIRAPLKALLQDSQALSSLNACWGRREPGDNFLNIHPFTMASLKATTQAHLMSLGRAAAPAPPRGPRLAAHGPSQKPSLPPLVLPPGESAALDEDVARGLKKLSVSGGGAPTPPLTPMRSAPSPVPCVAGSRPLPPLPISEGHSLDDTDCEVQFFTCSDTALLLGDRAPAAPAFKHGAPGRRSFRGCGQINYAYFETPAVPVADLSQAPEQPSDPPSDPPAPHSHRRLRRSHSGPAGSFHKPAARAHAHGHRASPHPDTDKPEVPPRVPIPPRPAKPDYRRWSAEVTSSTYSDEDRPPKVPPREPLSRSNSRTPSPKSLPSYLNGVMPPTQSFAPDPKYVSSNALQRQLSEGSAGRTPCILPIIENGRKVSSTHYYLLPERPPYLDRYERFFTEAEAASAPVQPFPADGGLAAAPGARGDVGGPGKRKHLSYVVSP